MARHRSRPTGSWCVVGLTPCTTADGRLHLDGAACAITPDQVVAVAEERVSRRTHQGGSELALRAVLAAVNRSPHEVDQWLLSTCGEDLRGSPRSRSLGQATGVTLADLGVRNDHVAWATSHHLSHALSAAVHGRPGDLVLVADDAGIDLGRGLGTERATAYVIDEAGVPRVVDSVATVDAGLGTAYRLATDCLGLDGYTECGKAMALAAFADVVPTLPRPAAHPMLAPPGLVAIVSQLVESGGSPRWTHRGRSWHDGHIAAAQLAQLTLERGLLGWVAELIARTAAPPARILWAGGVALNCRAVGIVADRYPNIEILVGPAPGDTGQALGNALLAAMQLGVAPPADVRSFALGPDPSYSGLDALGAAMNRTLVVSERQAADTLAAGRPVAIFDGRSELGPRALGQRSIVADPRGSEMRDCLNAIKGREPFRPFGLAAFDDVAARLVGRAVQSPAMLVAHSLVSPDAVPAAVHVDGTCRIQTVSRAATGALAELLRSWERLSGLGALVNTSFNRAGQPIVEQPADAIAVAAELGIDLWMPAMADRLGRPPS